MRVMLEDIT